MGERGKQAEILGKSYEIQREQIPTGLAVLGTQLQGVWL